MCGIIDLLGESTIELDMRGCKAIRHSTYFARSFYDLDARCVTKKSPTDHQL